MPKTPACLLVPLVIIHVTSARYSGGHVSTEEPETWTGRWLPERPRSNLQTNTLDDRFTVKQLKSDRIPMGVANVKCDDAKTNLTLDWDGSVIDYVCMNPRSRFIPDMSLNSIIQYENIPRAYVAPHFCMDQPIKYKDGIPVFGAHRPLWPRYGEYRYVPKQRWLHSLEHGGIVALYHPCADLREIRLLKKLVKGCLRRHVITPSIEVTKERPFVLLSWGVRLQMPAVEKGVILQFIHENALRGPEQLPQDGQYDFGLLTPAEIVSDFNDRQLCPGPLAHD